MTDFCDCQHADAVYPVARCEMEAQEYAYFRCLIVRTGDSIDLTAKEAETETSSPYLLSVRFWSSVPQNTSIGISQDLCVEALNDGSALPFMAHFSPMTGVLYRRLESDGEYLPYGARHPGVSPSGDSWIVASLVSIFSLPLS